MNARTNRPGGGRLARPLVIAFALAAAAFPGRGEAQTEGNALYRVLLLRAAPGAFEAGMEALRESFTLIEEAGDTAPFWLRHSQGDQWDFMLIVPLGDFAEYYAAERVAARRAVWSSERGRDLARRLEAAFAYREEWLARSIPREAMARRFEGTGLFHVEMFAGLPGRRGELVEQRRMENRYYEHLGRQQNVIFVRAGGSNWDAMTIGFHPDLQAFAAAGARFSTGEQDDAARAAGFDGVDDISPYLRSLLAYHHDTLAVPGR